MGQRPVVPALRRVGADMMRGLRPRRGKDRHLKGGNPSWGFRERSD